MTARNTKVFPNRNQATFTRNVKVAQKLNPTRTVEVNFTRPSGMPESFVQVLAYESKHMQITFHRPIGKTNLSAEDWVATETAEVPSLLERQVNPDAKAINDRIRIKIFELATTAGLFKQVDGKVFYPFDVAKTRADYLAEARKKAREATPKKPPTDSKSDGGISGVETKSSNQPGQAMESKETKAESKQGVKTPWADEVDSGKKSTIDFKTFLPGNVRKVEDDLLTFQESKEVKKELDPFYKRLDLFQTRSGPLADRDQVPVPYLQGKSREQAIDAICTIVMKGILPQKAVLP